MPAFVVNEKYELGWLERSDPGYGADVWLFEELKLESLQASVYPRLRLPENSPRIPEYGSILAFWNQQQQRKDIVSLEAFQAEVEAFFEAVLGQGVELSLDSELHVFNFPVPTCIFDFGSHVMKGRPGGCVLFKVPKTHCALASTEECLRFWIEYRGEEIPFDVLCDYFKQQSTAEFHEVRVERIFRDLWSMRSLTGLRLSASYSDTTLPDCILVRQRGDI